jgi:hypothetical protein
MKKKTLEFDTPNLLNYHYFMCLFYFKLINFFSLFFFNHIILINLTPLTHTKKYIAFG